jgi:hypothetical protein
MEWTDQQTVCQGVWVGLNTGAVPLATTAKDVCQSAVNSASARPGQARPGQADSDPATVTASLSATGSASAVASVPTGKRRWIRAAVLAMSDELSPLSGWRAPWDFRSEHGSPELVAHPPLIVPEDLVVTSAADAGPGGMADFFLEAATFLAKNYVEDDDGMFRFSYRAEHLTWSLMGGMGEGTPELIVALREVVAPHGIIAFAAASPTLLWVTGATQPSAFIDFVCVHKAHRGRRLCPLLYDILFRRLAARGITRVVKTTGSKLVLPLASACYTHVPRRGPRLKACGFSYSDRSAELPPPVAELRDLQPGDAASALALMNSVAERHDLAFKFTGPSHLAHTLLPRAGLVHTLVRADPVSGAVTDLVSCFFVESLILGDSPLQGQCFTVAYMYYFGATTLPVVDLYRSIAAKAKDLGADVFNALPISELRDLLYDPATRAHFAVCFGDGTLRYYAANCTLGHAGVPAEKIYLFPGV